MKSFPGQSVRLHEGIRPLKLEQQPQLRGRALHGPALAQPINTKFHTESRHKHMSDFLIQDGQTLLAQGDSITDAGRRGEAAPYGTGYVSLFREMTIAMYPESDIHLINKGIGGNRVTQLRERWDDDTIRHQPDWLTIMIGINDLHSYLRNPAEPEAVPPARYRENYDWILSRTRSETDAGVVLLEPFYFSISPRNTFRSRVLELLPEYIGIVHEMAEKHDTLLVETQRICSYHLTFRDSEQFCPEPVHPYRSGHLIIALELMKTLQGI